MTADTRDPVDAILAVCGISGPWEPLHATGIANRIYATETVVVRVATDHAEALSDARTESVAAPVAYAAGIRTPRLLVFDDSMRLLDRPYSVWERVHGQTLGCLPPEQRSMRNTWRDVGRQLALLHRRVDRCDDPRGYLDKPERNLDLHNLLEKLVSMGRVDGNSAREISRLINRLRHEALEDAKECFLHNDIHDMNIMCSQTGELMAVLDWGDAGWGDPTIEFAQIPLSAIPCVLNGYREIAPDLLGETPGARIVWDKLDYAMEELAQNPAYSIPLEEYWQFLDSEDCLAQEPKWRKP